MATSNSMWDQASKAGLVLGGVSVAYMLIGLLTGMQVESVAVSLLLSVVNFALWAGKLVLCIYLMNLFMRKFAESLEERDRPKVFRFGAFVALLSAVVYSAAYFAYLQIAGPEIFDEVLAIFRQSGAFTSDMLTQVEDMIPRMPTVSFFTNLVYCTLFGTIVSAVLSRRICPDNPF